MINMKMNMGLVAHNDENCRLGHSLSQHFISKTIILF